MHRGTERREKDEGLHGRHAGKMNDGGDVTEDVRRLGDGQKNDARKLSPVTKTGE